MKVLVVIVIILAIVALAQIMKVYNLSAKLRGKNEADVTEDETRFNAGMLILFMVVFMVSSIYLMIEFPSKVTGPSASQHGEDIDWLYNVNWVILLVVFFITQPILFIFAAKYRKRKGVKATFFAHSNKLELIWTVVPAVVLAFIIIFGLTIWNGITSQKEDSKTIELYAYQFGWFARYSGVDNTLGKSDFKVLDPSSNPLGIVTKENLIDKRANWSLEEIELYVESGKWKNLDKVKLSRGNSHEKISLKDSIKNIYASGAISLADKSATDFIKELEATAEAKAYEFKTDLTIEELKADAARISRQVKRLKPLMRAQTSKDDSTAYDDVIVKEMCLIKNQTYEFKFRSRDVIHSAFFPHFRAQMNCVPGMTTRFAFKPIYTTEEMREMPDIKAKYERINRKRAETGEEMVDFDYILLCNKICGASHFNMQLKITVVEDKAAYERWFLEQAGTKSYAASLGWSKEKIAELYGVQPIEMFKDYKPEDVKVENNTPSDSTANNQMAENVNN